MRPCIQCGGQKGYWGYRNEDLEQEGEGDTFHWVPKPGAQKQKWWNCEFCGGAGEVPNILFRGGFLWGNYYTRCPSCRKRIEYYPSMSRYCPSCGAYVWV
jgi:rubrerythrin